MSAERRRIRAGHSHPKVADMTDAKKWALLQREAERLAKAELLAALLKALGLDEYIAKAIKEHERDHHTGQ